MIQQINWAACSVWDFFGDYNWSGKIATPEPLEPLEDRLDSPAWLSISVEEFLDRSNWYGKPLVKPGKSQTVLSVPVTMLVSEFFHCMTWEGKRELTIVPRLTSPDAHQSAKSADLNLSNLSDLF